MREIWGIIQAAAAAVGGAIGFFVGGTDGMIYALIVFVICDYLTGVLCAIAEKKLSSEVGFKGIMKKMLIFIMVGIGNIVDLNVLGEPGALRTAIIFFYISNEGLSLLENGTRLGLPVPESLRKVLKQMNEKDKEPEKEDADE